jgi:glycosyltransferase involved in cell wall biosynthesis/GT2 family glycosyltransferase
MTLTVAIPTYGRDQVLLDTLEALLALDPPPWELLVVDQTPRHGLEVEARMEQLAAAGRLRWLRLTRPSITAAMNRALQEARGDRLLFLDDDILPDPDLLAAHGRAADQDPDAMVAGRVLQPWHAGRYDPAEAPFLFNDPAPRRVREFMGGNVAIPRLRAIELGGFDTNFVRVAYRFEAEFAHRWVSAGLPILYEPTALIHHLRAERGGTRSYGLHLTTARPDHTVGSYYFLLRTLPLPHALGLAALGMVRAVATRHHLRQPWWIPFTLVAEGRGMIWALNLHRKGPRLIRQRTPRLLIACSHPVQDQTSLFQRLAVDSRVAIDVLYLTLPGPEAQGLGCAEALAGDVALLEGYRWHQARSTRGPGITQGQGGGWLARPSSELSFGSSGEKPDLLLLTGWHVLGLVQLHLAARWQGIPVLLRMDSNGLQPRPAWLKLVYWLLLRAVSLGLPVGRTNARWYEANGFDQKRLIPSPRFGDNAAFVTAAELLAPHRAELRQRWNIPQEAFCFLFAGKLQARNRPIDLLNALGLLLRSGQQSLVHLLVVGSGDLESHCRELAAAENLPVTFAGFLNQSEMPAAYRAADVLVLPCDHRQTWGQVLNEAMACGLPAIVTRGVGGAEDLVLPGSTGLVVPLGDRQALAAAMGRMAADPQEAAAMGSAARTLVLRDFTVEKAAEGIISGVQHLVEP